MKRIASLLSVISTAVLLSATPLLSAEPIEVNDSVKDTCLLAAMNCAGTADSYQQRIDRLNKEIAKGTDVYTNEELRNLRDKLEDATRQFNDLIQGA